MAERFIIPDDTPLVYDPINFNDVWIPVREYNTFMNYKLKMKDPMAKTQQQYKKTEIYFFAPLITTNTPYNLGYHLISFKLILQGVVLTIDKDSFYRHGFLTHNDFDLIYHEGNLPYFADILVSVENEEMARISEWSVKKKSNTVMLTSSASDLEELLDDIAERLINTQSK